MDALLFSPVIWGAVGAVVAAAITAMVTNRKNSGDMALALLDQQGKRLDSLQSQIDLLEKSLSAERVAHDETRKAKRIAHEKFSVLATAYLSLRALGDGLLVRLDGLGVAHGPMPPIPDSIREDVLATKTPDQ